VGYFFWAIFCSNYFLDEEGKMTPFQMGLLIGLFIGVWAGFLAAGLMVAGSKKPPQIPPREERKRRPRLPEGMEIAQRILDDHYVDTGKWTKVTKSEPPR
jgi:hypothetical protein